MKAKYYCLTVIILMLISIFFPKLIIIHYQNVDEPLTVYLQQYDETSVSKQLSNGSSIFILKKGFTQWSNDSAYLGWYWTKEKNNEDRHEGFLSFIGENELKNSDLDLTICRVNIYLDKNTNIIKREVKYPVFMNLCI